MKLSISLSQRLDHETLPYAIEAEKLGFDGVYLFDHLSPPAGTGGGVIAVEAALGAIAACVPRVSVGAMVLNTTLRPAQVTRSIAQTLAMVAPGRGIVGLGMSDKTSKASMEQFGFPFLAHAERAARLAATIEALSDCGVAVVAGGKGKTVASLSQQCDGWNLWEPTSSQLTDAVAQHPKVSVSLRASPPFDGPWVGSLRNIVRAGCDELILAVLPATDPQALAGVAQALR